MLLEDDIGHELLNLPCHHHISELVLQQVFNLYDVSKSGDIELLGHFRDYWPHINQAAFVTAEHDENTRDIIAPWKNSATDFAISQLETFQPRDDYC